MRVDAISIPAAAQAASTVARSPSSAPRSFSATLALSVRSGAPEHHQDHSAALGTTAKSEPKLGAKSDAAAGAKFGVSLNAKSATKSSAKSDAKLAVSSATAPENQPSLPTYPLSASLLATLLTTSPTTSPTCSYRPDYVRHVPVIRLAERFVPAGSAWFQNDFRRPTRRDRSSRNASHFEFHPVPRRPSCQFRCRQGARGCSSAHRGQLEIC